MDAGLEHLRTLAARDDQEGRAALMAALREAPPDQLRFRQGDGAVVDLAGLVRTVRTDQPVTLVEPVAAPLTWSAAAARRWAADAVAQVLPIVGGPEEAGPLHFAVAVARQFADGVVERSVLDAVYAELFAEEWPDYESPYFDVVTAARQLVARDELAAMPAGAGVVEAGRWAAAAATAADAAASADGDPARGRAWQGARLLDYLLT